MKKFLISALVLVSTSSFAGLDKGVREATLKANKAFDLGNLDRVGSIIEDKKTGEILYNHCQKRDKSEECEEIIHILNSGDKSLVLHDRQDKEIVQSVSFLKYRLEMNFLNSISYFGDYDRKYSRLPGHFTSEIGGICIYEPGGCKLLILLPLTIAADLVLLPIDLSVDLVQKVTTRKKAKLFMKNLNSEEERIEMSHTAFLSMLKGLAQY
jgi:hypothetical protein